MYSIRQWKPSLCYMSETPYCRSCSSGCKLWNYHYIISQKHLLLVGPNWCTGAFSIVVKDPQYPAQPLYDYDVGSSCPVEFSITFIVPTDASDDYDKTLLVHIIDSYRTIKITVFRPAPNHTQQIFGSFRQESPAIAKMTARCAIYYGRAEKFRESLATLTATFPEIVNDCCCDRSYESAPDGS